MLCLLGASSLHKLRFRIIFLSVDNIWMENHTVAWLGQIVMFKNENLSFLNLLILDFTIFLKKEKNSQILTYLIDIGVLLLEANHS